MSSFVFSEFPRQTLSTSSGAGDVASDSWFQRPRNLLFRVLVGGMALLLFSVGDLPGTLDAASAQTPDDSPPVVDASLSSNPAVASIRTSVEDAIGDRVFDGALWGVVVADVSTGQTLYARNASLNVTPASNMKLFTSAAALETLGPEFRYTTTLYRGGPVVDGVLQGPLIVRGSGDPSFGGRDQPDPTAIFRQWADSLRAAGIREIQGAIVGDDNVFDDASLGRGWSVDDTPYAYAAEIGGLVFNRNKIDLTVRGQRPGMPGLVTWAPMKTSYVTVVNRSRTSAPGTRTDEEYRRDLGTNTIYVNTTVPPGGIEREELTVTNPTLYFGHVFREVLLDEGITVRGAALDVDDIPLPPQYDDGSLTPTATYTSPPLRDLVATINEESDNLYAEQILRTLAVRVAPDTLDAPKGSAERGAFVVKSVMANASIDTSRVQVADGSGLSRHNLVSPQDISRLLTYMWSHPNRAVRRSFLEGLPLGGRDGTIQYRFRGNAPAARNVRAKTGTLSNVSALSGYVSTPSGTTLAFTLLCTHHTTRSSYVRRAQDEIVNALASVDL